MALMSPITKSSVVQVIVNRIKDFLIKGDLKPGERLPSEQEMANQLAVGRGSVREAIKMLAALGVVEIHKGDGTYVSGATNPSLLDPLVFAILLQSGTSKELLELRALIETGYCWLAASKATDADFARLEANLHAWQECASSRPLDMQRLAELDLQFHHALIDMAQNPLVARVAHTVEDLFRASVQGSLREVGGFERAYQAHAQILVALKKRDPAQIHHAVQNSLGHWYQHLILRKGEGGCDVPD